MKELYMEFLMWLSSNLVCWRRLNYNKNEHDLFDSDLLLVLILFPMDSCHRVFSQFVCDFYLSPNKVSQQTFTRKPYSFR